MGVVKQKKEWQAEHWDETSIKTLQANMQLYGKNMQTIMFTSALPQEGKSSIAFYLARTLAQSGKKTILVDADIRNSVLLTRYETEGAVVGLSQYLSGEILLGDVIYETDEKNLSVIFACSDPFKQLEFLEAEPCQKMFEVLKAVYDCVIVDTTSMKNVIDVSVLAQNCDGVILVVESGAVSRRRAQKAQRQLEQAGARILGVVLNKVTAHWLF